MRRSGADSLSSTKRAGTRGGPPKADGGRDERGPTTKPGWPFLSRGRRVQNWHRQRGEAQQGHGTQPGWGTC
eukprot:3877606-Prymnesium_polylepis.1